jgi:D-amino peptidase
MKILIAADMEGISGVVNWDQVTPGHREYERFRHLMTQDVNAAIQGAFSAGASEVLVTDGHSSGYNILIEELDPRARLNAGNQSQLGMVQGVQEGVDGVFFIGYHACAGSGHAILDHTWSSSTIANVWLNDRLVGETGLNAAVCGHFNAPILMISGDQTVCGEAKDLLASLEFAVVKQATTRMSAECLAPAQAREKICEAAARAVTRLLSGQGPAPFQVAAPVKIRVEYYTPEMADRAERMPATRRLAPKEIEINAADMPAAYQAFRSAVSLARA